LFFPPANQNDLLGVGQQRFDRGRHKVHFNLEAPVDGLDVLDEGLF